RLTHKAGVIQLARFQAVDIGLFLRNALLNLLQFLFTPVDLFGHLVAQRDTAAFQFGGMKTVTPLVYQQLLLTGVVQVFFQRRQIDPVFAQQFAEIHRALIFNGQYRFGLIDDFFLPQGGNFQPDGGFLQRAVYQFGSAQRGLQQLVLFQQRNGQLLQFLFAVGNGLFGGVFILQRVDTAAAGFHTD